MTAARAPSLRWRLLSATAVVLALALLPAGWALTALFRDHATQQFREGLLVQLDQLTARVDFDAAAQPLVDTAALSDPRWQKPYSGLYWQIDGPGRTGVLRSRSLWDSVLTAPADTLANAAVHQHAGTDPQGRALMLLERSIHDPRRPDASWRLVVGASTEALDEAVARFRGQLTFSLLVLFALLLAASWAQVAVGLMPLSALRRSLESLRSQRATRLEGRFPLEVQPLVDDFNSVLEQNASVVERARKHAGNLAHAVKTPLTVLRQSAEQLQQVPAATPEAGRQLQLLAHVMTEQVDLATRHVDWHMARSRSAAQARPWGQATRLAPVLEGLVRVMQRVHAGRDLHIDVALDPVEPLLAFQGEEQDLQEMLGNLIDNACKWARSTVQVRTRALTHDTRPLLRVEVEDDGPGIPPEQLASVSMRGVRLDESTPGAGLGLAIVQDLVELYGGELQLQRAAAGGLRAVLMLPAAKA